MCPPTAGTGALLSEIAIFQLSSALGAPPGAMTCYQYFVVGSYRPVAARLPANCTHTRFSHIAYTESVIGSSGLTPFNSPSNCKKIRFACLTRNGHICQLYSAFPRSKTYGVRTGRLQRNTGCLGIAIESRIVIVSQWRVPGTV